ITGALMAIGLRSGHTDAKDKKAKELTYHLTKTFINEFQKRNKYLRCDELCGIKWYLPEDVLRAREQKIRENICCRLVKDAVDILDNIIFKSALELTI
ncbi:MAG: C-GCAxxG-C-C family protein, partial [bacterium]